MTDTHPLPQPVQALLEAADDRIQEFQRRQGRSRKGFVPSDYGAVAKVLQHIRQENLAPGTAFCEWGSGFGVITAMAAYLGFDACGIEIQEPLVDAAREFAEELGIDVEFVHGTIVPEGEEHRVVESEYTWWQSDIPDGYTQLDLELRDFDVVYVYPWPGEESIVEALFEHGASTGALLVTHHGVSGTRILRKHPGLLEELAWF